MLYNSNSYYPNKIDPLVFFQDIDLDHLEIMIHFQKLISQGKYTEACNYINQQEGIHGSFAGLFNCIENRLYSTQKYLLRKEKINPFHYTNDEPDVNEGEFWIE